MCTLGGLLLYYGGLKNGKDNKFLVDVRFDRFLKHVLVGSFYFTLCCIAAIGAVSSPVLISGQGTAEARLAWSSCFVGTQPTRGLDSSLSAFP